MVYRVKPRIKLPTSPALGRDSFSNRSDDRVRLETLEAEAG
jgi:hypothetical protein